MKLCIMNHELLIEDEGKMSFILILEVFETEIFHFDKLIKSLELIFDRLLESSVYVQSVNN